MNLLFLTSLNLASNPRLAKEIDLALENGYKCNVIQFNLGNWSDEASRHIFHGHSSDDISIVTLDATRSSFLRWLIYGLGEYVFRFLFPLLSKNNYITAFAQSRRSIQLLRKWRTLNKPDAIIAHNISALYPAYRLSSRWSVPFVFDMEDYYPGERIRKDAKREKIRRELLLKRLSPGAKVFSSASPHIEEYSTRLIGGHPDSRVILNSFPSDEFIDRKENRIQPDRKENIIQIIWFSQKIGSGRGLEELFGAMNLMKRDNPHLSKIIEITLLGSLDPGFKEEYLDSYTDKNPGILRIRGQMTQQDLHSSLSDYDIGLALEFSKTDLNRDLCLTNKILTYAQSGLYIMATNTQAQTQFINEDPGRGILCGQTPEEMAEALKKIIEQKDSIRAGRKERFEKAKSLAWENESKKLKKIWNEVLDQKVFDE